MKCAFIIMTLLLTAGCYSNQDRWGDFAAKNGCVATGRKKILYAGSVYAIPQRREVFEFACQDQRVWSDLGEYAKYNEWLQI